MLKSLHIQNYAIINDLSIDFEKGFNVFTGETGAGKSIIIGALTLLLKGKADSSVVTHGKDKAIIEGVFSIDETMKDLLDENDIEYDDDLIVKRVIGADGRNTIRINQSQVTLSFLNELFSDHIDIHSQKDSQYLLQKKNHRILLDKYCSNTEELKEYQDAFHKYTLALNEYEDLKNNTFNEKELDYLRYDLKEINDANLSLDEEEELEKKEKQFKSVEKYLTVLSSSLSIYNEENGIKELLHSLIKNLNIDDEQIEEIRNNIESCYYTISDEVDKLESMFNDLNSDDFNIEYIEERLYLYSKLKRKHALDTKGLIDLKNELEDKIALFDNRDYVLNKKLDEVNKLKDKALKLAEKLHKTRANKAKELEEKVVINTADLMLNNVQFAIEINEKEMNEFGIDDIEFMVSLNKNEELKPLKNVASGGEISRLMLSLKTVFASVSDTSFIVFDEIDTGVSGKVALAMGKKMKDISKDIQVLSITHLAPVAACADNHYFIYKSDDESSTSTKVRKLDLEERIRELASISSTELSESSLSAAEELYRIAQQ